MSNNLDRYTPAYKRKIYDTKRNNYYVFSSTEELDGSNSSPFIKYGILYNHGKHSQPIKNVSITISPRKDLKFKQGNSWFDVDEVILTGIPQKIFIQPGKYTLDIGNDYKTYDIDDFMKRFNDIISIHRINSKYNRNQRVIDEEYVTNYMMLKQYLPANGQIVPEHYKVTISIDSGNFCTLKFYNIYESNDPETKKCYFMLEVSTGCEFNIGRLPSEILYSTQYYLIDKIGTNPYRYLTSSKYDAQIQSTTKKNFILSINKEYLGTNTFEVDARYQYIRSTSSTYDATSTIKLSDIYGKIGYDNETMLYPELLKIKSELYGDIYPEFDVNTGFQYDSFSIDNDLQVTINLKHVAYQPGKKSVFYVNYIYDEDFSDRKQSIVSIREKLLASESSWDPSIIPIYINYDMFGGHPEMLYAPMSKSILESQCDDVVSYITSIRKRTAVYEYSGNNVILTSGNYLSAEGNDGNPINLVLFKVPRRHVSYMMFFNGKIIVPYKYEIGAHSLSIFKPEGSSQVKRTLIQNDESLIYIYLSANDIDAQYTISGNDIKFTNNKFVLISIAETFVENNTYNLAEHSATDYVNYIGSDPVYNIPNNKDLHDYNTKIIVVDDNGLITTDHNAEYAIKKVAVSSENERELGYDKLNKNTVVSLDDAMNRYVEKTSNPYTGVSKMDAKSSTIPTYKIPHQIASYGDKILSFMGGNLLNNYYLNRQVFKKLFGGSNIASYPLNKTLDSNFIQDPKGLYIKNSGVYDIPEAYNEGVTRYKPADVFISTLSKFKLIANQNTIKMANCTEYPEPSGRNLWNPNTLGGEFIRDSENGNSPNDIDNELSVSVPDFNRIVDSGMVISFNIETSTETDIVIWVTRIDSNNTTLMVPNRLSASSSGRYSIPITTPEEMKLAYPDVMTMTAQFNEGEKSNYVKITDIQIEMGLVSSEYEQFHTTKTFNGYIFTIDYSKDNYYEEIIKKHAQTRPFHINRFSKKYDLVFIDGKFIDPSRIVEIDNNSFGITNVSNILTKNAQGSYPISSIYIYEYNEFNYDGLEELYGYPEDYLGNGDISYDDRYEVLGAFKTERAVYDVTQIMGINPEQDTWLADYYESKHSLLKLEKFYFTPVQQEPSYPFNNDELYEILNAYVLNDEDIDSYMVGDASIDIQRFFGDLINESSGRIDLFNLTNNPCKVYEY